MADHMATPERHSVFDGSAKSPEVISAIDPAQFALRLAPPDRRWSLRGDAASLAQLGTVAGFDLTPPINEVRGSPGSHMCLRLGPDEWLLIAPDAVAGGAADIEITLQAGLATAAHTLVDISHRNVAIELIGTHAADVLNTGCPLDLGNAAFPVNAATRTLYAKAEVVLIRLPDHDNLPRYRIECWRSFGHYLRSHLNEAGSLLGLAPTA